jgi:hypothetical protein
VWLSAQEGGQSMKSKISVGDRATLASEIATLAEATPAARRGSAQGQAVDSGVVLRHERRYGGSALEEDRPVV